MYANLATRALSSAARYGANRYRRKRTHRNRVNQARRVNRAFPSTSTYSPSIIVTRQTSEYSFASLLVDPSTRLILDTPYYGLTRMRKWWDRYRVLSVTYSFETLTEERSSDILLYRIVDRDGTPNQYTTTDAVVNSALATVDHVGTGNYNSSIRNMSFAARSTEHFYTPGERDLTGADSSRFSPILYMAARGSADSSINVGTLLVTVTTKWQFIGTLATDTPIPPTVSLKAPTEPEEPTE